MMLQWHVHCFYSSGSSAGSAFAPLLLWKHCWRKAGMSELFSVFLPTCSCFGWELCFPGWQPGRKSTNSSSGGQHRHPSLGGKEQCLWLPVLLHIHAHGFSCPFVSTTLPFLGTRGPSVSHRWCLEPPVSLWWHSSALALCTFWFPVGICKATRHKQGLPSSTWARSTAILYLLLSFSSGFFPQSS